MKKIIYILIASLIIIILIAGYFYKHVKEVVQNDMETKKITNFTECVVAGNAVMESYPGQCRDSLGNVFVEEIGNELDKLDLIRLDNPRPNQKIESPLQVTGRARGSWFFEASFPVILTDWDGKIISEGIAQAQTDWMTEEFVPFEARLIFDSPVFENATEDHFSHRGFLILKKDNPSGLSANEDVLEVPVWFK